MKFLLVVFILFCGHLSAQQIADATISERNLKSPYPNYQDLFYWAAHPDKSDMSDSVPLPLKNVVKEDFGVDVFFIHPTTYTQKEFVEWNASLSNIDLNDKTDESTILYQASAFNLVGRIFAPRYRQAHINAFYINEKEAKNYFDTAYADIKNAFEYYLNFENKGRPIIIASHSQGTKHAGRLLKEFFEHQPLQEKLICAYIIGMPIPDNYFSSIPVCEDSLQTGCFVGWRTYKKDYLPQEITNEKFTSIVVNPLNWKRTTEYIGKKMNKGGVLQKFNKIVPGVVDAQIIGNILWSCKPDIFGKIFITQKNYHIGDINLFYVNIRENTITRTKEYLRKSNKL